MYDGQLDSLKSDSVCPKDALRVQSFFKDGSNSLVFKLSEKTDNMICTDNGTRIAFDHSYNIFSVIMRSAHSYKYASKQRSDENRSGCDLQQRSFVFVPKRLDNRPKFDGALAMPAPNLIQNDVCAERMAMEGSARCCCKCAPNRCAPCGAGRIGNEKIV